MSYKAAEVPSGDAGPDTLVSLLESALHVGGDKLLAAGSIKCFLSLMNSELLHFIVHIDEFDNRLSETHICTLLFKLFKKNYIHPS